MIVNDVVQVLEQIAPFDTQMSFDNAGLLIGSQQQKVHKIGVVLDVTTSSVSQAVEQSVDCIVSHHPIIFAGLKSISENHPVYQAIRYGIAVISAHTNLDAAVGGVNDVLADVLKLQQVERLALPDEPTPPMGRVGLLPKEMSSKEFAAFVGNQLHTHVKYVPTSKTICKVAVCGGSGADFIIPALSAGADALVTAEVKHHQLLEASALDFMVVDAGHYETEQVIIAPLCDKLSQVSSVPVVCLEQPSPTLYC